MQTFAILGNHPDLSLAELFVQTGDMPTEHANDVAIFNGVHEELTTLAARLGGVQKLGYIVGSMARTDLVELSDVVVANVLSDLPEGKMTFGISVYDAGDAERTGMLRKHVDAIGLTVKAKLIEANVNARYATSRGTVLSSAAVSKNQLLEKGAEYVFLVTEKQIYIGQTIAIQPFEDWSHRDYDRPARNAKRGMLPPKLARMMINLAGGDPTGQTLYDPFCGSGTVLMEAALVGYGRLIGSDISERAVADTTKNLAWLEREDYTVPEPTLFASKASNVSAFMKPETVDVIVTEPFLGHPRTGFESARDVTDGVKDLADLYRESFSALRKIMKPGAVLVVANPVHFVKEQAFEVPVRVFTNDCGFRLDSHLPDDMLYRREDQFVGRHILKLLAIG